MPLSSNIHSYEDLRPMLDEALASEKGIAVKYPSRGKALHARQRMYKFRALDRLASRDLYEVGHPHRGTSVYDTLNFEHEDIEGRDVFLRLTHAQPLEVIKL